MSDCRNALAALQAQGLAAWCGLPPRCTPAVLEGIISDLDPGPGMADLGLRKAFFRSGTLAASGSPVQVWTTTDEQEVLMLAFESPPFIPTGSWALEQLGPPGERLDNALGTVRLEASEWVYSARGLAVFVDPETDEVWRATLFGACRPEEYEARFRVHLLERRLPPGAPH